MLFRKFLTYNYYWPIDFDKKERKIIEEMLIQGLFLHF